MDAVICKDILSIRAKVRSVGYRAVGSTLDWWHRKPFSEQEAKACSMAHHIPLQMLLDHEGDYIDTPQVVVDCTPLHRHLDAQAIHSGEHTLVIERMVQDPNLVHLLQRVKMAFALFIRGKPLEKNFEILCVDPYGQSRSVAFARIVAHCLCQARVAVIAVDHFSKSSWQTACCRGECDECKSSPMSPAKAAALRRAYAIWIGL